MTLLETKEHQVEVKFHEAQMEPVSDFMEEVGEQLRFLQEHPGEAEVVLVGITNSRHYCVTSAAFVDNDSSHFGGGIWKVKGTMFDVDTGSSSTDKVFTGAVDATSFAVVVEPDSEPTEVCFQSSIAPLVGATTQSSAPPVDRSVAEELVRQGLLMRQEDCRFVDVALPGGSYSYLEPFWIQIGAIVRVDDGTLVTPIQSREDEAVAREKLAAVWVTAGAPLGWARKEAGAALAHLLGNEEDTAADLV